MKSAKHTERQMVVTATPQPEARFEAQRSAMPQGKVPARAEGPIDVSVIVPTYGAERYLRQCLASILQNREARLEVLVVIDGSPDRCAQIAHEQAARDPRVRVIEKENGGYGSACNRGIDEARGTYVAIVEPDDWVRPGFYDATLSFARSFPQLPEIIKTPYLRVTNPDTPRQRIWRCTYWGRIRPPRQPFTLMEAPRLFRHHPSIWSALYRRDFLRARAIRFQEVPGAGWVDNPFLAETLCQASSIAYLDQGFYCYREDLPGSSSMLRSSSLAFERWHDMADVLDRLGIDDYGIRRAHVVRGMTYLSGVMEEARVAGSPMEGQMRRMFARMDPAHVLINRNVPNGMKRLFCEVTGAGPQFDPWPYRRALVDELIYSLRMNGPRFALSRIALFFSRRSRIGRNNPARTSSAGM